MLTIIISIVATLLFVGLIGMLVARNELVHLLTEQSQAYAVRVERAEASEKQVREMVNEFNKRPFHIGFNDSQITEIAGMLIAAMPRPKNNTAN